MIKRLLLFISIILFAVTSTSCLIKSKADIEFRETVAVLGIDKEDDQIKLTAVLVLIMPSEGDSSSTGKTATYTATGKTMFDAIRNFHAYTDKDIIWGHMDFVLIGEDTAKDGIAPYIDIISRDHEIKQNAKLLITKGSTAYDFINNTTTKEQSLSDILLSLTGDVDALSESSNITILDYMQMYSCDKGCLYIPYLMTGSFKERGEEDKDVKDIVLKGYALFDEDKLSGTLDDKMARGLNWVIDKIETGIIVIEDKEGEKVSMEIISNKPKIETDFSGSIPTATIKIEFTTNIGEYLGKEDIFSSDMIKYLIKEQNEYVKKEITKTLEYVQPKGLDVMGISNAVYHKYPVKSEQLKDDWMGNFKKMDIQIEVNSVVNRTYNMNQPLSHKEK